MINGLAIQRTGEPSCLLIGGHKTTTPVEHEDFTYISPARFTHVTLLALSLPCRYAFVTWSQAYHICTEALHNPVLPHMNQSRHDFHCVSLSPTTKGDIILLDSLFIIDFYIILAPKL